MARNWVKCIVNIEIMFSRTFEALPSIQEHPRVLKYNFEISNPAGTRRSMLHEGNIQSRHMDVTQSTVDTRKGQKDDVCLLQASQI